MYTIQKVNCAKHPSEQLNNFCSNQNCKIALCASCIGEHTQNHFKEGTNPIYSNIKDVLIELNKQLERYIDTSRDLVGRITDLMQKIQNKQSTLKQLMKSIKNEAMQFLNNRLNILEQQLMNEISNQAQKSSYHNFARMQYLFDKVNKQKNIYTQCLQQMKKPQIAHNIKYISENLLYESSQIISDIKQEVVKNQQIQSGFIYNQDKLKQNIAKGVENAVIYFKNTQSTPDMNMSIKLTELQRNNNLSRVQTAMTKSYNTINSPHKLNLPNFKNHFHNNTYEPSGNTSMRQSITFNAIKNNASTPVSPNNRSYITAFNFFNQVSYENQDNKLKKQSCNRTISGPMTTKGNFRPFVSRNK